MGWVVFKIGGQIRAVSRPTNRCNHKQPPNKQPIPNWTSRLVIREIFKIPTAMQWILRVSFASGLPEIAFLRTVSRSQWPRSIPGPKQCHFSLTEEGVHWVCLLLSFLFCSSSLFSFFSSLSSPSIIVANFLRPSLFYYAQRVSHSSLSFIPTQVYHYSLFC